TGRTSTARCCRGTRGSPTVCSPTRLRTRRAATRPSSSRSTTSWSAPRTTSRRRAPARAAAGRRPLAGPDAAQVHRGGARLAADQEALDRRMDDDVRELVLGEEPRSPDGRVLRLDVVQAAMRQVGREDDVDHVLAELKRLRRDRLDDRDRPFELHIGLDRELLAKLAAQRFDERLAAVDAAPRGAASPPCRASPAGRGAAGPATSGSRSPGSAAPRRPPTPPTNRSRPRRGRSRVAPPPRPARLPAPEARRAERSASRARRR